MFRSLRRARTVIAGPLHVELNLWRLGRPQFTRGPGFVAISWGNGWETPAWTVEVEVPW